MVGLIMAALKVAWLVQSYGIIISYLAGYLPKLIVSLSSIPYWDEIVTFLGAAVSTCRWLVGDTFFNFAISIWLLVPVFKLIIYFSHKAASFGELAGFFID